jgi:hypothetical protein
VLALSDELPGRGWYGMKYLPNPIKWKHFESHGILQAVRWYLQNSLSYQDIVELLVERRVHVSHTTIMGWVHQYGPGLDKRVSQEPPLYWRHSRQFLCLFNSPRFTLIMNPVRTDSSITHEWLFSDVSSTQTLF